MARRDAASAPGAAARPRAGAGAGPRAAGRSRGRGRRPRPAAGSRRRSRRTRTGSAGRWRRVTVTRFTRSPAFSKKARAASRVAVPSGSSAPPEALEGHPERGPSRDVDAARAVGAQPELVLVLVDQAAAEGRGEKRTAARRDSMAADSTRIRRRGPEEDPLHHRRQRPVPPGVSRDPRAGHEPRPAHERHLRLHHHAAQALRGREARVRGHQLRRAGPDLPPRGVQGVQGQPREDGRRPRGADSLRATGLRGLEPAHPRRRRASRPTTSSPP